MNVEHLAHSLWGPRSTALGSALLLPTFLMISTARASPVTCPPDPGDVIREENVGGGAAEDKLVEEQTDEEGNKVELWCIDDAWFGKRYAPKNGAKVWVGKCWFPGGRNWQDKCSPDSDPQNGKPDEWQKLSWMNVKPPGAGALNWEYTYWATGPNAGKLKVDKTTGGWSDPYHVPSCTWWRKYTVTASEEYSSENAPTDFSDIPGYSDPKRSRQVSIAAGWFEINPMQTGPVWEYGIALSAVGGSGEESDPYLGLPVSILPGDTWTLAAAGVSNPYVTGSAEGAGWIVDDWGSEFVSYNYSGSATVLDPGHTIEGFCFQSAEPAGQQQWTCYGEGLNYAGVTMAPVLQPAGCCWECVGSTYDCTGPVVEQNCPVGWSWVAEAECYTSDCGYPCPEDTPAVSEWGLIVLGLLLVTGGTIVLARRRTAVRLDNE